MCHLGSCQEAEETLKYNSEEKLMTYRQSYRKTDVKTLRDQIELEDITTTPEEAEKEQVMIAQPELEPWQEAQEPRSW